MHRKNLFTIAGVALIVLLLTGGCGPKADPTMVSKVNSFFAAQTDKTYKGAKNFTPVPLAVGQYVTHGNTEKNGKRSVTRTAIVGKESGGWILENYSVNEYSESCSQMLIKGMENIYNPRRYRQHRHSLGQNQRRKRPDPDHCRPGPDHGQELL